MSRRRAYLLGVLAHWPIIYIVFFLALVGVELGRGGANLPVKELFVPHIATLGILLVVDLAFYQDLKSSTQLSDDERAKWKTLLLLGAPVTEPMYWWTYVRPAVMPPRSDATP